MLSWALVLAAVSAARAEAPAFSQLVFAAPEAALPAAPVPGAARALRAGELCLFDGRTGLPASEAAALAAMSRAAVVHAGERHDDPLHHKAQAALVARLPGAGAGFEMLYASQQAALDRYMAGALDDAGFQAEVDWPKTWGFPFPIYKPVFDAARAAGGRAAALNVTKAVVHKVAISGLGSLTPAERAEVPADFEATRDPAYLAMLKSTFEAHGGDPADAAGLARFVDAMSLWNEGMAASLLRFLDARPGGPVVVAAGAFHAYTAGVPASLARRRPALSQVTLILETGSTCPTSLAPAAGLRSDYRWVVLP
jgi:uncharacterized iron-regulated protein